MFKPLQEVKFKVIDLSGSGAFQDCTIGSDYIGYFMPKGSFTPTSGAKIHDNGGLAFVDDIGEICTLSVEGDSENILIL